MKVLIYWLTKDEEAVRRIRQRFGIPVYVTLNGWNPALIRDEDREVFEETARRGFLRYMPKEWTYNGHTFSW